MYKPFLDNIEKNAELITAFGGYNHNFVIEDNEFFDEKNMSSDNYPALSPRNKRAFFKNVTGDVSGIYSKTKLCYIKDGYLYYGGEKVTSYYFGTSAEERSFVSMGARLIVFPDNVYINTNDFNDYGTLDAKYVCQNADVYMCRGDGDTLDDYAVGRTPPESPSNGDLWLDTSEESHVLKEYIEATGMWSGVSSVYVSVSNPGIGKNFKKGDGVRLSGFQEVGLDGTHIIKKCGDDYITIVGTVNCAVLLEGDLSITREIPEMDFVCENNNRLWGCSSKNNEIYASKLGDPTNFNVFDGLSTDSYAVSVGTDGEFTAAVSFRGYILFFKENCLHKIYGSNPPYTVTTSYLRGVQKGSHHSVKCLNETLYYKSPTGVCAYEGGVPVSISAPFGKEHYTNAVGGTYKNKYYICMTDRKNKRNLFCFDEEKGLWHKEDEVDIRSFANNNCNLYFLEYKDNAYRLGVVDGENMYGNFAGELENFRLEENVEWFVKTGLWGLRNPFAKYYTGLTIRARGEAGSVFCSACDVDSSEILTNLCERRIYDTGSFNVPIITPRADHVCFYFKGTGKIDILSVMRKICNGSDDYV